MRVGGQGRATSGGGRGRGMWRRVERVGGMEAGKAVRGGRNESGSARGEGATGEGTRKEGARGGGSEGCG